MSQPSVMQHSFSQAPSVDLPRSSFKRNFAHKTTFNAGELIPIFHDIAFPGDTMSVNPHLFARINTPIDPIMDNIFLDIHFFSIPIRQIWDNWRKFNGEQTNPGDSIDFTIPKMVAPAATGYLNQTLSDYLGLPTYKPDYEHSALWHRAYQHAINHWYRDQNLIDSYTVDTGNGPDTVTNYAIRKRGKRHDYFTSCLPWLQKGDSVEIPLGQTAEVKVDSTLNITGQLRYANTHGLSAATVLNSDAAGYLVNTGANGLIYDPNATLYADLSTATAATVNVLRQQFQIQKVLERDARGGTRYPEMVKAHFGVDFLDVTYRPEFLGGGSTLINMHPVPQTSQTQTTPQGTLAAFGTASLDAGGFTKSFTEHCIVLGIISARADLTYQQGLDKMFSYATRYDFYLPAFAHIGEQAVLTKELYCQDPTVDTGATGTPDNEKVFGYQERWAEMRYKKSLITGKLRSNDPASLDSWHLSQEFGSLPELNQTFIEENPPMARVVAVTTEPDFILDSYFEFQHARVMPTFSVPGLIDHF